MKYLMKRLALFCSLTLLFSACFSPHRSTWSDGKTWIPADFDVQKDILLIETFPLNRRSNEHMKQWLAKNYTGRYAVADRDSILSKFGKYADTEKYRFAMLWDRQVLRQYQDVAWVDGDWNGHFYDRLNDHIYDISKRDAQRNNLGSWSYMPFLNTVMKYGHPQDPTR